jgi:hypothetical protein
MSPEYTSRTKPIPCAAPSTTTLGAISSGTVHSRVGACDPRDFFSKRVLNGDPHRALAIASLSCGEALDKVDRAMEAENFHFSSPKNLKQTRATLL